MEGTKLLPEEQQTLLPGWKHRALDFPFVCFVEVSRYDWDTFMESRPSADLVARKLEEVIGKDAQEAPHGVGGSLVTSCSNMGVYENGLGFAWYRLTLAECAATEAAVVEWFDAHWWTVKFATACDVETAEHMLETRALTGTDDDDAGGGPIFNVADLDG